MHVTEEPRAVPSAQLALLTCPLPGHHLNKQTIRRPEVNSLERRDGERWREHVEHR